MKYFEGVLGTPVGFESFLRHHRNNKRDFAIGPMTLFSKTAILTKNPIPDVRSVTRASIRAQSVDATLWTGFP